MLVAIGIIALLIGLLLPAISHGRDSAKRISCVDNLRQCFVALSVYADEHNGVLPPLFGVEAPPHQHWMARLESYGLKTRVVFCPADPNLGPHSSPLNPDDRFSHSYVLNGFPELNPSSGATLPFGDIANPSEVVLMGEKKPSETDYYLKMPSEDPLRVLDEERHGGRADFLFMDGHVSSLPKGQSLSPRNFRAVSTAN